MKKTLNKLSVVLLIIFSTFFLTGCFPTTYYVTLDVPLKEVERPSDALERYGEKAIEVVKDENKKITQKYSDGLVNILWFVDTGGFLFEITNKTSHSIKIIWDEAAFINHDGSSGRVMHTGVKYIERNNSQPPTIIPRGASVNDIIIPCNNVYYNSYSNSWTKKNLFGNISSTEYSTLDSLAQPWVGKQVQVLLPLEHQGVLNEYIFTFEVDDYILPDTSRSYSY